MQAIGLIGETIIIFGISQEYSVLINSIERFIIFDGLGLIALTMAALILKNLRSGLT
jgi:hypothetical protein